MKIDVRRAIKARGVNTVKLAERMGIAYTTLHYLLRRGSNLTVEKLNEFARLIECPVTDFFVPETEEEAQILGTRVVEGAILRPDEDAEEEQPVGISDKLPTPSHAFLDSETAGELTAAVKSMAEAVSMMARSVQRLAEVISKESEE